MKKTIRSLSLVLLSALMLALLTSCRKTPSDTAAFKALANEKGYVIFDVTDQYINAPQIKEATIAAPSDKSYQIEFYIITDVDSAKELFQAQTKVMDEAKGNSWSGNVSNGRNYAKSTVITNGQYMMLCYIENTVLYVPLTDKDNREAIEKFVDAFKY